MRRGEGSSAPAHSYGWRALDRALNRAVRPDSDPSTLAIVSFDGAAVLGAAGAEEEFLGRLGGCLAHVAGDVCGLFESRRGEFCLLLCDSSEAATALAKIRCELDELLAPLGARTVAETVALPDEAGTPRDALALADVRLRASLSPAVA